MTILGGVDLDNSLYLEGVENSILNSYTQYRSTGGVSAVAIKSTPGGRNFVLGSVSVGSGYRGFWTQSQIDAIKKLEVNAVPVDLEYCSATYRVLIVGGGASFRALDPRIPETDMSKIYTGTLTLIEV